MKIDIGFTVLTSIFLVLGTGTAARAQNAGVLEEIIVTATRVETNQQQTPMSVQVFSGDELVLGGIDQGRDLGIMVPNVTLNPTPRGETGMTRRIRGLPGVLTYFDGFSIGGVGFLQRSFIEMERIEILRGPQGTHFGRNSNGGAIQLVSRKPAEDFRAGFGVELGEFSRRTFQFSADVPISDRLLTKWTIESTENEGFLESQAARLTLGSEDSTLVRGDILWLPTDRFSLRLVVHAEDRETSNPRIVRFSNEQSPPLIAQNVLAGNPEFIDQARAIDPAFPDPPITLAGDRFTPRSHQPGFPGGTLGQWETRSTIPGPTAFSDNDRATLTINWDLGDHWAIEHLTSYSGDASGDMSDMDGSEFSIGTLGGQGRFSGTTQEFHAIGSHLNGRLRTLLGAWYSRIDTWGRSYSWFFSDFAVPAAGPAPPPPNFAAINYVRSWGATVGNPAVANIFPPTFQTSSRLNHSVQSETAVFGELAIGILDRLDLTVGFRIAGDNEVTNWTFVPTAVLPAQPGTFPDGDPFESSGENSSSESPDLGTVSTPRVSLAYTPTDEIYLYASYAEGFTQGNIVNIPVVPDPIFLDPEVVKTKEIGLRSDWLGGRLRFNATVFDSIWDGLRVRNLVQVENPNLPGTFREFLVPSSSGLAASSGLEFELNALPGERWDIRFSMGTLDTEYLDIGDPPANGSGLQPGIPFAFAPELSYSLAVRYRWPLASGAELILAGDYGWMDEYQRAVEANLQTKDASGRDKPEPSYGLLNARVSYQSPDRNWSASVFGTNLTDEWYVNGGSDTGFFFGFDNALIGRPRELGVGFRYTFD